MAKRPSYQARRNEIAHALGYKNFQAQRTAPPAEVARKKAALNKRMGGSYKGKSNLKAPRGATRVTATKNHVITVTSSRTAFRKAITDATKKERKQGGQFIRLTVRFGYVRENDSETGTESEGPADVHLFAQGWRSRELLDRLDHPLPKDHYPPGDEWAFLERFAKQSPYIKEARGVRKVTIEAYGTRPAESTRPQIEERFIKLSDRALAMDDRARNSSQYDWLDAEGYLDKMDAGTLTESDLARITRHQERWL
jgi:hypothetical protein